MKSQVLIEAARRVVLRIDDQCEDRGLRPHRARDRIYDHRAAKPASPKCLIDGEPADQDRGQGGIARQTSGVFRREIGKGQTGRRESVVAGDLAGRIERDKAVADPTPDVLCRQFPKIPVERRDPAGKAGAVICRSERRESEFVSQPMP